MTNYTAIQNMTLEQMETFLDQVYCTGLNTGGYAVLHEEDEETLSINPFDISWLTAPAEKATAVVADQNDEYVLDAFMESIFRSAGISPDEALRILEKNDTEKSD